MIKNFAKKSALFALIVAGLGMGTTLAQAQEQVYVRASGMVVKSGTGLCWRTGYWTPAAAAKDPAGCECDKDLLPKEVCAGKAAAAATPTTPGKIIGDPKGTKVTLAADTLFDFDKAVLRPEGKKKLDELAASVKMMSLEVLLAVGHTDRIGTDEYNKALSEKRAAAVKEYLVSKGLEANRIYSEGKGEKQPKTGNKCDKMGAENGGNKKLVACLQEDRRVDIEVIGYKK